MKHAWLVIEPAEGDGTGVQRQFDGDNYHQIEGDMKYALIKIGALGVEFEVVPNINTEGELVWANNPGTSTGLMWRVCPCTPDGTNLDHHGT